MEYNAILKIEMKYLHILVGNVLISLSTFVEILIVVRGVEFRLLIIDIALLLLLLNPNSLDICLNLYICEVSTNSSL